MLSIVCLSIVCVGVVFYFFWEWRQIRNQAAIRRYEEARDRSIAWREARRKLYVPQCDYYTALVWEIIHAYKELLDRRVAYNEAYLQELHRLLDYEPPPYDPVSGQGRFFVCYDAQIMRFVLHSYRRCPFCIRSRIILHLKGIEHEIVEEPLREWTVWMREWAKHTGERSRVPVLQYWDEDGVEHIMPESNEINFFLDAVDGTAQFTPRVESPGYVEMMRWWSWCDVELKPMIDLYKYGKNREWDRISNEMHMRELGVHLQKLETRLADRAYMVEERLTLTDIAIIPFVRQIMRVRDGEFDFSPYPQITSWANSILETDWFKNEVMKKYPLAEGGTKK